MLELLSRAIRLVAMARSPQDRMVRILAVLAIVVVVGIWGLNYNRSQAEKNAPPVVVEAGAIVSGTPVDGTLIAGQRQAWELAGTTGQRIAISVDGNWDSALELYLPGSTQILTKDEFSGGKGKALIEGVTLPQDGIYRVVLSGEYGQSGDFRLQVTDSAAPTKAPRPAIIWKVDEAGSSVTVK